MKKHETVYTFTQPLRYEQYVTESTCGGEKLVSIKISFSKFGCLTKVEEP